MCTHFIHWVSTRKVDDLVDALGVASGISKSEVSRICAELDREMEVFRTRRLDHIGFPYLFCDATYVKGRVRGRVVSRAVVVVTGVSANGNREVLGCDVGDSANSSDRRNELRDLLRWCHMSEGIAWLNIYAAKDASDYMDRSNQTREFVVGTKEYVVTQNNAAGTQCAQSRRWQFLM